MKILVVTEFPVDAPGGGPAVIRQMLKDFPGEIHWWSCRGSDLKTVQDFVPVAGFTSFPPGKLMPIRKWTRVKSWLMEHVWAPLAARSLKNTIEKVGPDSVWMIPHDWSVLPLHRVWCAGTSEKTKDRLTPDWHVTIQDYPDVHGHAETWGKVRAERIARMQEELYKRASSCDATSLPMLEDLKSRSGRQGMQMLHQGLEKRDFDFLEKELPIRTASHSVRIAYAGTILVEREFAAFTELLEKVRESGLDIRLELWGAHSYADRDWFRSDWMKEHGNLPEAGLLEALRLCDWGFIPMAMVDQDPRYNQFSFPTKFITYLAAGLPIISMGDPGSSVMKMSESYDVGVRISGAQFPVEILQESLGNFCSKQIKRPEILRCARDHFDAVKMRKKLWKCFILQEFV